MADEAQWEPGEVLIVSGMSGAGRSTAADALEDLDWYVVDNLPPQMLKPLLDLTGLAAGALPRVAVVVDVRGRDLFTALPEITRALRDTRQQVRSMVEDAGGAFFLVHVATPLDECERRDRKGLYAKARRGEIPEFTGISSPYEEPVDPAVRVDTTGRTIEDALDDVLVALDEAGYLHLRGTDG